MKTMTCQQLGGACDQAFRADTFDEIARQSQAHGVEMYQKGDQAHIEAMQKMKELSADPEAMQAWMAEKRKAFEAQPDDN